jgi:hypothetical protein
LAEVKRIYLNWLALMACSFLAGAASLHAADRLLWQSDAISADISGWDLPKLLQKLSTATGWQIYVEPETERVATTKFKDRSQGEALRLLLGDLNYALLPSRTNGPARLYVFRTTMQEATQLVKAPAEGKEKQPAHIGNELVVTLKPSANIDELAKKLGAKVTGRLDKLNTYRLEFDNADAAEKARASLQENEDVASIENNFPISRPPNPDSLTASSYSPIDLKPKANADGSKLIIGLIDTAVQKGTSVDGLLLPTISVVEGNGKLSDKEPTHGLGMADAIARAMATLSQGGETSVQIQPIDVYGGRETTSTFDVAMGIYKVINDQGARIVNLSLGAEADSPFLHKLIQSGYDQGVLFFAAPGNVHVATPTFPAAYPEVIAVTAGTRQGEIAPYANYGSFVDAIAPGVVIVNYKDQSWVMTGTSVSTAYGSGVAASIWEKSQSLSRDQVAAQFLKTLGIQKPK